MGAIALFCLYFLLGTIAIIAAVLLIKFIVHAFSHVLYIIPEYTWHNLLVLLFVAIVVGSFVLLILFA